MGVWIRPEGTVYTQEAQENGTLAGNHLTLGTVLLTLKEAGITAPEEEWDAKMVIDPTDFEGLEDALATAKAGYGPLADRPTIVKAILTVWRNAYRQGVPVIWN